MHPNTARKLQILSHLESLLAPDNLLTDPRLCALMASYGCNALPLQDILCMNPFVKMNVAPTEIEDACQMSRIVLVMRRNGQDRIVSPGYNINPQVLLLRGASRAGTVEEVRDFVRALIGLNSFILAAVGDGTDYALMIQDPRHVFAFWRATKYVRFRGDVLSAEMDSPTLVRVKAPPPVQVMRATSPVQRRVRERSDRRRSSSQSNARKKGPRRRPQERIVFDEESFPSLASV